MSDYKMPEREQDSNKGTFGKVLNFAGSKNYIGAAYLSTVAILRTGAGFAALASEKNIINSVSSMLPEAVYLSRKEGLLFLKNVSVVLAGCGLGTEKKSKKIFKSILNNLKKYRKPAIIDADGLNILSTLNIELPENTIITPHPVEAARLLNEPPDKVIESPENAAENLVDKYNCTVVLKGHRTIITNKENYFVNQHGNSALAKAGSGDVLAGIIAGLIAQKMDIFDAAKLGVYLHSRAGEIASEKLTEYSVLASELPVYLPEAIKEIL